jgi:hypothetical protein
VSTTISDTALQRTLAGFAAVAARALDDPASWLGDDAARDRALPLEVVRRVRRLATGRCHPGSSGWQALAVDERSRWWVRRIQVVAAPIAATPRVFGAAADRLPLQGAFGAAAAGLTVCAVAREHGLRGPAAWVPLLGRVIFERDLARPGDAQVVAPPAPAGQPPPSAGLLRRARAMLWRLTWVLWEAKDLFDERPRGAWVWRVVGKVPVIGLAGGFLDERGALAHAAQETSRLIGAASDGQPDAAGRGAGSSGERCRS